MAKGVVHAGKGKSLSSGEGNENERRGWDEMTYRQKNKRPLNNYDWSRSHLNFEVVDGKIVPLGSQTTSLYGRFMGVLKNLNFRQYKDGASNQQHTYVELILSGSTERMQQIAFGNQKVDFTRNPKEWKNWDVSRTKDIEDWALDCFNFVCEKYGKENIIGFEVHLDETEPHIHVNIVPTAVMQQRGQVGGYIKIDKDGNDMRYTIGKHIGELIKLNNAKYERLSDEKKKEYRPNVRSVVRTISYSAYFGRTLAERSAMMSQLHTDFYEKVGKKWGLERGDVWADLSEEERRKRRRRTKEEAYLEKEAKEAKQKAIEQKDAAVRELQESKDEISKSEKILIDQATAIGRNKNTIEQQKHTEAELQKNIDLMSRIENLTIQNVSSYVQDLESMTFTLTNEIRSKLVSSLKEHPRIQSTNHPLTAHELERIAAAEMEKIIKKITAVKIPGVTGFDKHDANKAIRDIRTDVQTIYFDIVSAKQKAEIAKANREIYKGVKQELADVYKKAAKYNELEKVGITEPSQVKELKKSASKSEAAEDMLEFTWPGITKAVEILTNPTLDEHYMTDEQKKDVQSILRSHPEDRISDMLRLLKYACTFRNIPLVTQAEALMLSTDNAISYIKSKIELDYLGEAKSMVDDISSEINIEKPVVLVNEIIATAACMFFGFLDGATTISAGGGGGGGQDLSGWSGKKDDENDRQFAARCLMGAAQMRLPKRGMKKGR